ncbi:bifunctional phosphopantothenoylcysteine decarboxylase/phosphopantothenate--cysteine ligase CoaBC [Schaalia sp. lx-260]|uniref:bifunctional phosphopantothenoylcysteine decarboxylase/phosphopantothenate--cysteine ligase CoaBC n=1 Tax=Schaalia sp. lx-260 TaxID=2899082 RepID=UPI001E4B714D|nr:bifunctional phosphopantothenoylcysteine decarboxylase/phosphopantothenate--cysteine ligase CoaBC [Schaalia sp. lx-260]MCD4549547.1 bifunctional phosphopantothenoylcysteine decarboxylase/phosphopantothenate--cysteine ligase CoaBC [Schaalia sp. lx-260]
MSATIILGVGAGIAAYKAAYILREFTRAGHTVHVVPTPASLKFVGEATWSSLSQNPVHTGVFDTGDADHVELARRADLIVIAPATADLIARIRLGQADDLLTTTVLASSSPVLLAPAMHTAMWTHPATQDNIATLQQRGIHICEPEEGPLGSGDYGKGRLADPHIIAEKAFSLLQKTESDRRRSEQPLQGRHIVITAGGTREPIDPVRYIGNISTGRQGCAFAQAALDMGAQVTLIASHVAPDLLPTGKALTLIATSTAADMEREVFAHIHTADALIMTAAVADFRPQNTQSVKIKKDPHTDEAPVLALERTTDILATVCAHPDRPSLVIGFAAETGSAATVRRYGIEKARRKGADFIAVNRVGEGHGFGDVPNEVYLMNGEGNEVAHFRGEKICVARDILTHMIPMLGTIDQ